MNATALIAEDEPLLAAALKAELTAAWPNLQIVATVGDGASAVREALAQQPDVLFFDIQMPGMNGLDAALTLVDLWPDKPDKPFPALVFVTAYEQYAVRAFDAHAVDYLLKPVQATRIAKTVSKLQSALASRPSDVAYMDTTLAQLRNLSAPPTATTAAPLKVIQASVGSIIRMVPIDEVLCFDAADKYVRVLTAQHEYLIRTPLKELGAQLDTQQFWQIHRGTIVRAGSIDTVSRDEAGKLWLTLRGHAAKIAVSRLYAHLFKAM